MDDNSMLIISLGKVNWKPHFLFFIVPAGLQIIISMVLFIITATHCNRVKREIHRMQSSGSSESASKKEKFMASKTMYVIFCSSDLYDFLYWGKWTGKWMKINQLAISMKICQICHLVKMTKNSPVDEILIIDEKLPIGENLIINENLPMNKNSCKWRKLAHWWKFFIADLSWTWSYSLWWESHGF